MTLSALEFTLRAAVEADAHCVATLGTQVFLDTYATDGIRPSLVREVAAQFTPDIISALIARPQVRLVLAERAGHLIGFAQFDLDAPHALLPGMSAAQLNRLYVQERFTGRGVGRVLLAEVETRAAAEGVQALWLSAWAGNARALAFYPRRGYRDIGATLYEFENEKHENRIFARQFS